MSVASLSLFRFDTVSAKLWAWNQMLLARRPLSRVPDIGFHKLLGTGTREGFYPYPNFSVLAILADWPSLEVGRTRFMEAPVFQRYRAKAREDWTVFLGPIRSRGAWAGRAPFAVNHAGAGVDDVDRSVAVITRATIRPRHVLDFWRQVPDIARSTADRDGLVFQLGLAEIPWLHQMTFTIWRDTEALDAFAFRGFHGSAIGCVRAGGWFSEALFARFRVLHVEGRWEGSTIV